VFLREYFGNNAFTGTQAGKQRLGRIHPLIIPPQGRQPIQVNEKPLASH
jgi:hypothetical protein